MCLLCLASWVGPFGLGLLGLYFGLGLLVCAFWVLPFESCLLGPAFHVWLFGLDLFGAGFPRKAFDKSEKVQHLFQPIKTAILGVVLLG